MILGSHNSWSYKKPTKFWAKALAFTAKCQRLDIKEQYRQGVRCFDLRLRGDNIVHNNFVYGTLKDIEENLAWLNVMGDAVIRVVHDVRKKKDYNHKSINTFMNNCLALESTYTNIKFWCGRNLYNWEVDYDFPYKPGCVELYSSVCPPNIIDDWIPIAYAKMNNHDIRKNYTIDGKDNNILLIDFIDIK